MASSKELIRKRSKYYALRDDVNNILRQTLKTYSSLTNADKLKDSFTIDGESADNGKISDIRVDIGNINDKLKNIIIPEINYKINSLSRQIEQALTSEEEEEREEERRQREQMN